MCKGAFGDFTMVNTRMIKPTVVAAGVIQAALFDHLAVSSHHYILDPACRGI